MKYKVMIVEDQTMPRELFELRIQSSEHFETALSIDNASLAEVYCLRFPVDLILMDVVTRNGERSFTATPNKFLQAVSKETANRVKDVLKGVVTDGTGTAAALPGVEVAGKTGTAEKENGNDSWFVGMAPADNPRVVVAINLELADEGMGTERAQNVLRTALQVQGLL